MDVSYKKGIELIQEWLGATDSELAKAFKMVDPRAISRWKSGDIPRRDARRQIEELYDLCERINEVFPEEIVRSVWLNTDAPLYGGFTRLEIIILGKSDMIAAEVNSLPDVNA